MSINMVYTVTDCRNLSRAELLGFISVDFVEKADVICNHLGYGYFDRIIRGPWKIHCDSNIKSIAYHCIDKPNSFYIKFKPNQKDGIIIQYINKDFKKIETQWSVEEIIDFLGV